ncbi:right-handed parallel beta-helix repeat-containing protein [Haladaptatus sp. NG-WS-4]
MTRTRRSLLRTVGHAGVIGVTAPSTAQNASGTFDTIRIPERYPTIQDGVDNASEGDLVLVSPGTYEEEVEIWTPRITVRGTDRNRVVLDGEFERPYGVVVEADGVAVENVTGRHFTDTAFYWSSVRGFRGSYLTAYNNGNYGIYAYRSRDGRFEYSYASGHPDAGFYLGRNHPFHAVIADVVAERNAMGYSGTSAGGDLTIENSVWRHNMAGIVPNTLDRIDPPQRSTRIVGNVVYDNDNVDAPSKQLTYPTFGTGILVWGGKDNLITDNDVRNHENFGIVAYRHVVPPSGNVVRENRVRGSKVADLALGTPAERGNRFEQNAFSTSLPPNIERDSTSGDRRVTDVFEKQERRAASGDFPGGDWRKQPPPGDQPTMPDPEAPPQPASKSASWGGPESSRTTSGQRNAGR